MSDNLTPEDRLKTMRAVKGKGTKLEQRFFSMLAGMRIGGWKKNVSEIVGKPDVVFLDQKVVVFIDGCFWHGCPVCQRKLPKTNKEYWEQKIKRNILSAKSVNQTLQQDGWKVIRVWEHEMRDSKAMLGIKKKLNDALNGKD
jgi:DNA mismatch endonuclease (patch repair protein)